MASFFSKRWIHSRFKQSAFFEAPAVNLPRPKLVVYLPVARSNLLARGRAMFDEFQRKTIELNQISLDPQNPRIVTLEPLTSEAQIIDYFFEYEGLRTTPTGFALSSSENPFNGH